jgi:hypothetical protein
VPLALHIEADRMRGLLLRPNDWNLERGAILAELAASASDDVDGLEEAVRNAAYGTSPFAHDPGGTARDVLRAGVGDLRRAYDAGYQPDNATPTSSASRGRACRANRRSSSTKDARSSPPQGLGRLSSSIAS